MHKLLPSIASTEWVIGLCVFDRSSSNMFQVVQLQVAKTAYELVWVLSCYQKVNGRMVGVV